ncbi:magnesium transporter, partial [Azospirillum brasilense]|nr:magnesium transporter [Azospirillum brasilense]
MHTDRQEPDRIQDDEPHPAERPAPPREDGEEERAYGVEPEFVEEIVERLHAGRRDDLRAEVDKLHPADIADLIEQLGHDDREALVGVLRPDFDGEVLSYLNPDPREEIVELFEPKELAAAVAELDTDDAVDVIEGLDEDTRREVLENLPAADRALVQENLTYDEDTAGRLMQRDLVAGPQFWTVGKTTDAVRAPHAGRPGGLPA